MGPLGGKTETLAACAQAASERNPESTWLFLMQGTNRRLEQSSIALPTGSDSSQCVSTACAAAYLCFYSIVIYVPRCSALSPCAIRHNVNGFTRCLLTELFETALQMPSFSYYH